jgi:hypothetical protein
MDMGAGIRRCFYDLFIGVSGCFTITFLLGGALNWYFLEAGLGAGIWKNFVFIQLIAYGIIFLLQIRFTFLTPIIVTGRVFIFPAGTYFFATLP